MTEVFRLCVGLAGELYLGHMVAWRNLWAAAGFEIKGRPDVGA